MSANRVGLDFFAGSMPHFAEWLAPIWHAFPESERGIFCARAGAFYRARELGIDAVQRVPRRNNVVVVASHEDARAVLPCKVVLVNHGVGQRYEADPKSAGHPAYSGGRERDNVVLHLCPSERDVAVHSQPAVVVGVPRLDSWYSGKRRSTQNERPVVCFSFHHNAQTCAETNWALPYYREELIRLAQAERDWTLVGHAHPRARSYLKQFWERLGVPFLESFDEVLALADLYVCDNSSTLYEFASTDRPVLVLNAPHYRRDVHHGLRFWDAIPGLECDSPDALEAAVALALTDPPEARLKRAHAVQVAYGGLTDGRATERAVAALLAFLHPVQDQAPDQAAPVS